MADLAALLCDPQAADPAQAGAQIALAGEVALICHLRLAAADRDAALPHGAARLAQDRLAFLWREIEALEQARSLAPLPDTVVRNSLAEIYGALVEWAAAAAVLTPGELSALVEHRRAFGHPWADPESWP